MKPNLKGWAVMSVVITVLGWVTWNIQGPGILTVLFVLLLGFSWDLMVPAGWRLWK